MTIIKYPGYSFINVLQKGQLADPIDKLGAWASAKELAGSRVKLHDPAASIWLLDTQVRILRSVGSSF
jgi:hypothetical protein